MAKNTSFVLLGYQDEMVTDKFKPQVDFTVNKIGGVPDFHCHFYKEEKLVLCNLCKFPCRLVVQIYGPLDNSKDHRTLYVFACINPTCWNRSESWTCLRAQVRIKEPSEAKENIACVPKLNSTDWCLEAEDWGDDDNIVNLDEQNCNVINNSDKLSEDEESSSFDDSMRSGFRNLSIDDKNANNGAQGGAVARVHPPMATAEIEGSEDGEVISVDSPTAPKTNLEALLHAANSDMDNIPYQVPFVAYFISVYPEEEGTSATPGIDSHVKELLSDYQRKDADFFSNMGNDEHAAPVEHVEMALEEYEKSRPLHGDKMFHHFVTKIKSNPEQILRYHRDGSPLLLYPLQEPVKRCKYCNEEQVFEFQLIPTIISKLRLESDPNQTNRLDFGTVLIYTCKSSCWDSDDFVREESVIVQKETF